MLVLNKLEKTICTSLSPWGGIEPLPLNFKPTGFFIQPIIFGLYIDLFEILSVAISRGIFTLELFQKDHLSLRLVTDKRGNSSL